MKITESKLRKIIRRSIAGSAPSDQKSDQDAGEIALDGVEVKTSNGTYRLSIVDGQIELTYQSIDEKEPNEIQHESQSEFFKGIANIIDGIRDDDQPKDPSNMNTDNRTGALNRIIFKMFPENDMGAILRRIRDYKFI